MSPGQTTLEQTRLCPDCHGVLYEIKIDVQAGAIGAGELAYSLPEARTDFPTGKQAVQGTVAGFLCDECGRILLYAQPKA